MSGAGKCFPPGFSTIGLRLPPAVFLLLSLTLATLVGCGGGAPRATPQATIALSPATLSFSGSAGSANPGAQTVAVSNTGTAALNFTAVATSTPSGWLVVSPTSGTVAVGGSTTLTVTANLAGLAAGSFSGSIRVAAPGASNSPRSLSVSLAVTNPPLTITSVSPASAIAGGAAFTLTVTGSGFIAPSTDPVRPHPGSVAQWNESNRTTTFVSSTQLAAAITAADIAAPGTAEVRVVTPAAGTSSNVVLFGLTELIPGVGVIERASVASNGAQGSGRSASASISADGRFVAFQSDASDLVAADTNGVGDIFVHDRQSGQTTLVSIASDGAQGNSGSISPSISADGRFVAFATAASNLVSGDTNVCGSFSTPSGPCPDVFVRDTCVGASGGCVPSTIRVSVASDGTQGNNSSGSPSISADGRFVAFGSGASNLVPGDTRGCRLGPTSSGNCPDVFLRDTCAGAPGGCVPSTVRVSVASDGSEANERSAAPSLSADGRLVVFHSSASNLVPDDTNGSTDIFVHDRQTGQTTLVSVANDGAKANSVSSNASISADGRFIAFVSPASNLVSGNANGFNHIFLRDTCRGAATGCTPGTARISVASDGTPGDSNSVSASMSADGRYVAFVSSASNLVPGDANGVDDVFLRDTCRGATGCTPSTVRLSVASNGTEAAGASGNASMSADGRFVAFGSEASKLVTGDSNGFADIFVATTTQVSAPVIITNSLPDGTVGTAYSAALNAVGGLPPSSWSVDEGGAALPPGVTLDPNSGVLSGVPMLAGTFNFTARVTDSASPARSDAQALILTIR